MKNPIPLLDLRTQLDAIRDEVVPALLEVVESQRFIMGDAVGLLEEEIARFCGAKHAIACASGTDALLLSLKTLDLKPGDEVITTPFTFFATAGAIHNAGGIPVFVDIDPATFNLDPELVDGAINERTRAIVAVHLFGQMAPMEALYPVASAHGIEIIEDAAQAFGARRLIEGERAVAGVGGLMGTFSFFPSKNLGGWGDGGMIVTAENDRAERLKRLRTHGGAKQYHHDEVGTNSRLDTLQAAVLLKKLAHVEGWNAARRDRASRYAEMLADVGGVVPPMTDAANEHVFHQYTIRAERRDDLLAHLKSRGVGCAVYYPIPLHLQPCFEHLEYRTGSMPESERASEEVLSLPVYPELTDEQQADVVEAIAEFYA